MCSRRASGPAHGPAGRRRTSAIPGTIAEGLPVADRDLQRITRKQEESEQARDDQERPGRLALPVDRRVRRDVHPQLALDEAIDQIAWQASEEALLQRGLECPVPSHPGRWHGSDAVGQVRVPR